MNSYAIKGRMIDAVSDTPIENGIVVICGTKIQYAGEYNENLRLPQNCTLIDAAGGTILPGFIDCHTHLCGTRGNEGAVFGMSNYDKLLNAAADIHILLNAGFTTVRDMSAFGAPLKKAVSSGTLHGPRIIPGGKVLSPTAGHCDCNPVLTPEIINQVSPIDYLMDGVENCLKGVRLQFREGAEFIKICATGGVSSSVDELSDIQFSPEEMRVIVEEAQRHGTYVAAHCSGNAGTYQALQAGIGCVEHGDELDDRCISVMKEKDIPVVTTLFVTHLCAETDDIPDYMTEKASTCLNRQISSLHRAHDAGIKVALGTDFSNSRTTPYAKNGMEFEAIVKSGFTPMEAIRFGTINAAFAIRKDSELGSLEEGKLADIVVVAGNPLEDITLLSESKNIMLVMKNGTIEKNRWE